MCVPLTYVIKKYIKKISQLLLRYSVSCTGSTATPSEPQQDAHKAVEQLGLTKKGPKKTSSQSDLKQGQPQQPQSQQQGQGQGQKKMQQQAQQQQQQQQQQAQEQGQKKAQVQAAQEQGQKKMLEHKKKHKKEEEGKREQGLASAPSGPLQSRDAKQQQQAQQAQQRVEGLPAPGPDKTWLDDPSIGKLEV